MSSDRDTTRIVRSWLEDGVTRLPDRVLDSVLDELPTTPQRRATPWPARRHPRMNNSIVRFGVAAAAVVIVAIVGFSFLSRPNLGGDADSTPAPRSAQSPKALPIENVPLEAGTYVAQPFAELVNPEADAEARAINVTLTVPDGWRSFGGGAVLPVEANSSEGPDGMSLGFGQVHGLYSDPCEAIGATPDIAVGPTVDDLARALAEQAAYEATSPTDVTLGGHSGKRMDLLLPSEGEYEACITHRRFHPWDGSIYAQGLGNRWHLWILDVDGVRMVVQTQDFEATPAQDQAELQAIVDSIRIES
jgi:hypothetical protein